MKTRTTAYATQMVSSTAVTAGSRRQGSGPQGPGSDLRPGPLRRRCRLRHCRRLRCSRGSSCARGPPGPGHALLTNLNAVHLSMRHRVRFSAVTLTTWMNSDTSLTAAAVWRCRGASRDPGGRPAGWQSTAAAKWRRHDARRHAASGNRHVAVLLGHPSLRVGQFGVPHRGDEGPVVAHRGSTGT